MDNHLSVIFMYSSLVAVLNTWIILRYPYAFLNICMCFIEILGIAFKSIAMDTDLIIDIVYHRVIGYEYRPVK